MSSVGSIVNFQRIDKGSAEVTYCSADEAAVAVKQLQSTTILGNARFIDVLPKEGGERSTKRFNAGGEGGVGGRPANTSGGCGVLVRGFDFGTTEDQLLDHMSSVGSIVSATWIDDGSAEFTYSSAGEGVAAMEQLQSTMISGNKRFIDVLPVGSGGRPTNLLLSGGKGCGGGMPANAFGTCVLVRGFDFGTTEMQLGGHMSRVGSIVNIKWIDNGSAQVKYSSEREAVAAVQQLQSTTIYGNKRFIDVLPRGGGEPHANLFLSGGKGGVGGMPANALGNCCVFVRGFDFGTTEEQLLAHMSRVGSIMSATWIDDGSAEVTYSSAHGATAAVQQLQGTTIYGNKRFIDVFPGGKDYGGGKGDFLPASQSFLGHIVNLSGKGGHGGKSWRKADEDPPGSGRVFVRGFDFGTDDKQVKGHMSTAGAIHKVYWLTAGSADVVYKDREGAIKAASGLHQTTIQGNSRYIDVILKDS